MKNKSSTNCSSSFEEERDIYFGIINRFIGYFTVDSQKESHNDEQSEYPFVPMDTRQVFQQIETAKTFIASRSKEYEQNYSFLDIGCGIGNVLLFAEQMGFDVFGIEKDPFPCAIAQKLFGKDRILEKSIWDYDEYHQFDTIYYFRPFHDRVTQERFEHFIEDRLVPGGVLIANRKMSNQIDSDPRFEKVTATLPVWYKKPYPSQSPAT